MTRYARMVPGDVHFSLVRDFAALTRENAELKDGLVAVLRELAVQKEVSANYAQAIIGHLDRAHPQPPYPRTRQIMSPRGKEMS